MPNLDTIIEGCQKGEAKAEKALFLRFAPRLFGLCRRYSQDDQEAQDFVQECFLHLFNQLEKFDSRKGPFESWFFRVCTNHILGILRQRGRDPQIIYPDQLPETEPDTIHDTIVDQVDDQNLLAAIRQLPAGYQEVLNLYVFEQWSHREIAQKLGISESTSRSQLVRAKQLLKKLLLSTLSTYAHERLA
jgi:RNA polymerase sigma factor (sigma-70 family)